MWFAFSPIHILHHEYVVIYCPSRNYICLCQYFESAVALLPVFLNTLKPIQNYPYFSDDISKCIFLNVNYDFMTFHYLNQPWSWCKYASLGLNALISRICLHLTHCTIKRLNSWLYVVVLLPCTFMNTRVSRRARKFFRFRIKSKLLPGWAALISSKCWVVFFGGRGNHLGPDSI